MCGNTEHLLLDIKLIMKLSIGLATISQIACSKIRKVCQSKKYAPNATTGCNGIRGKYTRTIPSMNAFHPI